jgi:hypothetical protein
MGVKSSLPIVKAKADRADDRFLSQAISGVHNFRSLNKNARVAQPRQFRRPNRNGHR